VELMELEVAARLVGTLLSERHLTLSTAESCTGGLIASAITDIAGSSSYFLGGAVTYSNQSKQTLLGLTSDPLIQFGAVSAPVALAMAQGARRLFGTDLSVSSTGIAGPGGGTPAKPVGLAYVALSSPRAWVCRRLLLPYDRLGNKRGTATAALQLVLAWVAASSRP